MACEKRAKSNQYAKFCRCSNPCQSRCECGIVFWKKKSHPPFNSGVPIDVKRGMHPIFAMNSNDAPPPGTYDPKPIIKNCHVTSWKREEAVKEFAATMGGRLDENRLIDRELMKSGLGPGTHEVNQRPEMGLEENCAIQRQDTGFGVTPRFKSSKIVIRGTPGPGYTGKDHNPFYYIERNRLRSFSRLATFEFDGLLPRFKNREMKNWSIAPNRYNAQHPECLDKILKKVTGKRGPYDLFTGPRDSTTLYGYIAQPKSPNSKNWPVLFPTEFEKAFYGSNRYKGIWTDCPRFTKKPTVRSMLEDISLCYKDPDSPGPGSYDPAVPSPSSNPKPKSTYPFNDSVKNVRPLRPWDISPGPGTYDLVTSEKEIPGGGWTWSFKSKVQRRLGPRQDQYNSF